MEYLLQVYLTAPGLVIALDCQHHAFMKCSCKLGSDDCWKSNYRAIHAHDIMFRTNQQIILSSRAKDEELISCQVSFKDTSYTWGKKTAKIRSLSLLEAELRLIKGWKFAVFFSEFSHRSWFKICDLRALWFHSLVIMDYITCAGANQL